jgi:hypothetical protein
MTSISLRMQWPLTSQYHGSFSQREILFFFVMDQTPRPRMPIFYNLPSVGCFQARRAGLDGNRDQARGPLGRPEDSDPCRE